MSDALYRHSWYLTKPVGAVGSSPQEPKVMACCLFCFGQEQISDIHLDPWLIISCGTGCIFFFIAIFKSSVLRFVDQLETKLKKIVVIIKIKNSLVFGPADSEHFLMDSGSSQSCFMGLSQTRQLN